MDAADKQKVAKKWGESSPGSEASFYTFGPVVDYLVQCVSGDPKAQGSDGWVEKWAVKEFLQDRIPVNNCLSLCCGFGFKDRRLARLGVFKHCTAIDLSEGAIKSAQASALAEGIDNIDYLIADLDHIDLGVEQYDLVYASGALHHLYQLERIIGQIYRCLKPGGILLSDEYVGPTYSDFSPRHRELVNAAIHLLPRRLRHACENTFVPREWQAPPWRRAVFEIFRILSLRPLTYNLEGFPVPDSWAAHTRFAFVVAKSISNAWAKWRKRKLSKFKFGQVWDSAPEKKRLEDPSEGVRADEIIPIIRTIFHNPTVKYFNGSILQFALDRNFFANYDPDRDWPILRLLMELERTMIETEEIPPILAVIVACKGFLSRHSS